MLFIGYLINEKKQSSTVRSYISAIKAVLKSNKIKVAEDQYLLASLTRACKLQNDKIRMRLPIQKDLLSLIVKETRNHFLKAGQMFLASLYQTLFCTTYFGLLRMSEVTKGEHPVLARDVHIRTNKKKFLLILRTSKTHGLGTSPQMVKISCD